jgi:hypothetical protein
MFKAQSIHQLIPESAFMTVEEFNSEFVKKQVEDKEAHQKSVRHALSAILKEKIKEQNRGSK